MSQDLIATEVGDGIAMIRSPDPQGILDTNVYLVRSDAGPIVVDVGWNTAAAMDALVRGLRSLSTSLKEIEAFLITHCHWDHAGLAGALQKTVERPIWMAAEDLPAFDASTDADRTIADSRPVLRSFGLTDEEIARAEREALSPSLPWPAPTRFDRGFPLSASQAGIQAFPTPGHSPGHTCFARGDVVFTGDHLLRDVTPNIPLDAYSGADPLGDFIEGLHRLTARAWKVALPAHGPTIDDVPARVAEIIEHHEARLAEVLAHLDDRGSTVHDVAKTISWSIGHFADLEPWHQEWAMYETAAHLAHLERIGRVERVDGPAPLYRVGAHHKDAPWFPNPSDVASELRKTRRG